MSGTIKLVGIGAFESHLTAAALTAINQAKNVFLQTHSCYLSGVLQGLKKPFKTFDALYEQAQDFDSLNKSIAHALSESGDAVYALPGSPVGLEVTKRICELCPDAQILPGVSYTAAALASLCARVDATGALECFACDIGSIRPDGGRALALAELDNAFCAAEAKQALGRYYGDEQSVFLCDVNESGDGYEWREIPLFELDRQEVYKHTTCVVIPPLAPDERSNSNDDLIAIVRRLRAPGGCPWDAKQTTLTLKKDLLEEAYELCEAIDLDDPGKLCEEIGDVSLVLAMIAEVCSEHGEFDWADAQSDICKKLIYRHPHVFANQAVQGADEVLQNWESLKRAEKGQTCTSQAMAQVCKALPALVKSEKLQKKAAAVGFDWANAADAFLKVEEETLEVKAELDGGQNVAEELGDLLFAVVNVCRLCGINSEDALGAACEKFIARFAKVEKECDAAGKRMNDCTLEELDALWDKIKHTPT